MAAAEPPMVRGEDLGEGNALPLLSSCLLASTAWRSGSGEGKGEAREVAAPTTLGFRPSRLERLRWGQVGE